MPEPLILLGESDEHTQRYRIASQPLMFMGCLATMAGILTQKNRIPDSLGLAHTDNILAVVGTPRILTIPEEATANVSIILDKPEVLESTFIELHEGDMLDDTASAVVDFAMQARQEFPDAEITYKLHSLTDTDINFAATIPGNPQYPDTLLQVFKIYDTYSPEMSESAAVLDTAISDIAPDLLTPAVNNGIDFPYSVSQFQQLAELAQTNGFISVRGMLQHLSTVEITPNDELFKEATAIISKDIRVPITDGVYLEVIDESSNQQLTVCEVQTTPVIAQFAKSETTTIIEPIPVTGLSMLVILAASGIWKKRTRARVIDGIKSPGAETIAAAKAGSADALDRLISIQYLQALHAAEGSSAYTDESMKQNRRKNSKRIAGYVAFLAAITGVTSYLSNPNFAQIRSNDPTPALLPDLDCDPDSPISFTVFEDQKELTILLPNDLDSAKDLDDIGGK